MRTLTEYTNDKTVEQLQFQLKAADAKVRDLQAETVGLRERLALLEKIDAIVASPPQWVLKASKKKLHTGMPTLMLSDCHWDEVVRPEEVEGINEYNREIAIQRLQSTLEGTIVVAKHYFSGLTYPGITLLLGGDMFSGNIHEELQQTNADTIYGSLDFWSDYLVAFIESLQKEFEHVHVAGVVGNHGRNTRKPRAKFRARDNLDWLLYRTVAKALRGNGKVTFQIPESADCTVKIYDTIFRLTHGDQFRGGSGIAGMLSPLLLGSSRKSQRQAAVRNPFDWLVMGHWHEYWAGKGIIVNGSLKGYDEYAYVSNFAPQRPIQAFWVTTPENGLTFPAPIFADARKR